MNGRIAYSLSAAQDSSDDLGDVDLFHGLLGQVTWEASPRLSFTIADSLSRSDEPTRADRLNLRRERRPYAQNTFSAAANYLIDQVATTTSYRLATFIGDSDEQNIAHTVAFTAGTVFYGVNSLSGGYEYLTTTGKNQPDTGNLGSGASNVEGHRFNAAVSRQISQLMSAGISGSYAIRNADTERGSESFDSWSISVFNAYSTSTLSLAGSLGYSRADTSSAITSTTALSYRFARASASIAFDSGFSETYAEGQNFGLVETRGITASLSYPFTPAVSGTLSSFYRQNRGTGSNAASSDTWGGGVSLSVLLTKWLSMSADYGYTAASSSGSSGDRTGGGLLGNDYTENRASIALSASF